MHPWKRKGQLINERLTPQPGVIFFKNNWYIYNPLSEIVMRLLGRNKSIWPKGNEGEVVHDPKEFTKKFSNALQTEIKTLFTAKQEIIKENTFRLIHGDADGFPGIVADLYENYLVIQINHFVVEMLVNQFITEIEQALQKLGHPVTIICKKNHESRKLEGLSLTETPIAQEITTKWNGLKWSFMAGGNQKTGGYLDQRDNHLKASEIAQKYNVKKAIDLCCFEGGFGLHLAKAGIDVISVDQSSSALERVLKNAKLNNLENKIETVKSDIFKYLSSLGNNEEFIILDPPSFTKNKAQKKRGIEGLKNINSKAISAISKEGGILVSCTCSQHISNDDLLKIIDHAVKKNGRTYQIIHEGKASSDHTTLQNFPESDYLRAKFIKIDPISN